MGGGGEHFDLWNFDLRLMISVLSHSAYDLKLLAILVQTWSGWRHFAKGDNSS